MCFPSLQPVMPSVVQVEVASVWTQVAETMTAVGFLNLMESVVWTSVDPTRSQMRTLFAEVLWCIEINYIPVLLPC